MLKMIALLKRKPHLTHEQFVDHWMNTHGPIAYQVPELRRYIQSHIQQEQTRADIPSISLEIDGIAELWFDDENTMKRVHDTPEMQALLADGALFIGEIKTYFVHEHEVPLAGSSHSK